MTAPHSGNGDQDYSPAAIRYWLTGRCPRCHWAMLESAVEGGTCSGGGSGRGERFGLAHLKADLERAADSLPLHWQATAYVFAKQHRYQTLSQRRQTAYRPEGGPVEPEHPVPSAALDNALLRMARSLGWREDLTNAA